MGELLALSLNQESTPDDVVEEYLSPKRTQFNATQIVESLEWIRPGNMR